MAAHLPSSKWNIREACCSQPTAGWSLDFGFHPRSVTISLRGFCGPTFPKP